MAPARLVGSYGARSAMKRRRQNVLLILGGAVVITGMIGFGMGYRSMMVLNILADALFVGYVYLLIQLRRVEEDRAMRYAWSNAA